MIGQISWTMTLILPFFKCGSKNQSENRRHWCCRCKIWIEFWNPKKSLGCSRGTRCINFCHQKTPPWGVPTHQFLPSNSREAFRFWSQKFQPGLLQLSFVVFFNPEVPALGEPTPESPSAGNASGTESPARRRAAHASLRAVGAAAPGVEGLRKGRPRRFRCWKPRQRRMSGVQGGWKKPRFEAEDVWRNAVDWVQLCGFFMFLWVVGMVF